MKSFFMVRHGESELNAGLSTSGDSELTVRGCKESLNAMNFIKKHVNSQWRGYVSPLVRCLQTALPIARNCDVRFNVTTKLYEAPGPNTASYAPSRAVTFLEYNWYDEKGAAYSGVSFAGETQANYEQRLDDFLKDLPDKAVVVTHRDCIHYILGKLFKTKPTIYTGSVTFIEDGKLIYAGLLP